MNDDVTTMEFVVDVLEQVFEKDRDEAVKIMLATHEQGSAVCGLYGQAEARRLANEVIERAKTGGFPLECVVRSEKDG
ncbi:MAG: ATP-dependent Clp protease adaptor ClpS [Methylobacteriaceae bacterium]|nr:ATP-dependent Clp protease adaptor ClpS [Methylobacteriaceae bacterium]MBV9243481.1 ATP-dependent Clp protease adaptor ClpS [Methylobacteriaceae bacterium]